MTGEPEKKTLESCTGFVHFIILISCVHSLCSFAYKVI